MSRSGCLSTIKSLLEGVSGMSPAFVAVSQGEPLGVPTVPWCAYWLSSLATITEMDSMGEQATITSITVRSYFPASLDPGTNEAIVEDIWDAIAGIRSALLGDANLSGNCSQIHVNDATVEIGELNGVYHYQATQVIDVWILGDTTVTP